MRAAQLERSSLRLVIVEDSPLVRIRLIDSMGSVPGVVLSGWAESAPDAIETIRRHCPDVVVLDLTLTTGTGFDVLRSFVRDPARPVFLIFSNSADEATVDLCTRLGAEMCLDKSSQFHELLETVEVLALRKAGIGRHAGAT